MSNWFETEKGKAYRQRHKEYLKKWRKDNFALKKAIQQRSYEKIKIECFNHYGNGKVECRCCGEKEIKFLHLDHKNGDGAIQRKVWIKEQKKIVFGGGAFYYWLRKNNWPDIGLQVLCANCNLGKRANKYCPHELRRGIDMDGNPIPEEELPKPFPEATRRLRGEAIKEAQALGISVIAMHARERKLRNPTPPKPPQPQSTHCKNGHTYTALTLYSWTDQNGKVHRQCRQCKRDYKVRVKAQSQNV